MTSTIVRITWGEHGYTDIISLRTFGSRGTIKDFTHPVLGPKGGVYYARCAVRVEGQHADLDYGAYPETNDAAGWYVGVMRLTFVDHERQEIKSVFWQDIESDFVEVDVSIGSHPEPKLAPYKKNKGKASKALKAVPVRAGQVAFRKQLLLAYGGRCCVTGCSIPEALEAAHIDPFYGPASDHPQNGLLLRHDLHDLLDAGLMGIHPITCLAYFPLSVQEYGPYRALHGRASLSPPLYGGEAYSPSQAALKRRWTLFLKRFGKAVVQQSVQADVSDSRARRLTWC